MVAPPIPAPVAMTRPVMDTSTAVLTAKNLCFVDEANDRAWLCGGHRGRATRCQRRKQRRGDCGGHNSISLHSHVSSALVAALPVTMVRPVMPVRRMPLSRPDIGRHIVRFRAAPDCRPKHLPRVIPNRPMVPAPVMALMPAMPDIMGQPYRRVIAARGGRRARSRRPYGSGGMGPNGGQQGNGSDGSPRHTHPQTS